MTTRVVVAGKHLSVAGEPFRIRGVTYGGFLPRLDGVPFPDRARIKEDFRAIAEAGLNTVRTYELPPDEFLETADEFGLRLLIGLHYHDWRMEPEAGRAASRRIRDAGRREIDRALERCAGYPHVIAIAVGNEVPADIVRVHGIASVEDVLGEFVGRIHAGSDDLLATYVNYPTTEYLSVDGQDLVCCNVFLQDSDAFRRYVRHLQVVAGVRPLVITELGLGAAVHGERRQAELIEAQLRDVDENGCAGATVFAWTDEWGVAGHSVEGWGFGITTADREPKPALDAVRRWAGTDLACVREHWPRVSVIVCAYNEQRTIGDCLASLAACTYPNLEVMLCDDGSTDATLEIARRFPFRILELDHGGLSRARNAGLAAATGDIVAYLDADATCHPHWPFYLALSLEDDGVVAVGGPNLGFICAGLVERAVTLSPGAPTEVLIADDRAEHVPGCNMAYRKDALESINGFNEAFVTAGDDVDVCWKLLERGHDIAFAPAAQVWHHRRSTVRGYLRQQRGYGRAERMLTGAHPHRFNRRRQAQWKGFIYGGAAILPSLLRPVVYHGVAGAAPYQPISRRRAEVANMYAAALVPFTVPVIALSVILGAALSSWWFVAGGAVLAALLAYGLFVASATRSGRYERNPYRLRMLVGLLHVLQPFARTWGRLRGHPLSSSSDEEVPWDGDRFGWLRALTRDLRGRGLDVTMGCESDAFDLRLRAGPFLTAQVCTAVVWRWEPQASVRYAATPAFWALMVTTIAFGALASGWVAAVSFVGASCILAAAGIEMIKLRREARRALARTTVASKT